MINLIKPVDIKMESVILRNESIDDTDLDGEKVMMDLDKGQYFMMNEVGSRIWDLAQESITVNEIVQALLSEYDVEEQECKETVISFLKDLHQANLVKIK